jgi:3-hydroxyisobutyrate dehydrogenase-like beta-hydroxyacid dehydrogenase
MTQRELVVGIVSPGDMGNNVGRLLHAHGARVVTSLAGRSQRTHHLAEAAGIEDVGGYKDLVSEATIVLSILVPSAAVQAASEIAQAVRAQAVDLLFVDCNAIAPQTVQQIEAILTGAGARFVDASIIGPPPRKPGTTRFYASGSQAPAFAELGRYGLDIHLLAGPAGQASGFKMCYAALTKGFTALCSELLAAAELLGVGDALAAELDHSQPVFVEQMRRALPGMPPKARRWVGEMEEIAQTFASLGLTPQILAGAADLYQLVGETALADRTPEETTAPPTVREIAHTLAHQVQQRSG